MTTSPVAGRWERYQSLSRFAAWLVLAGLEALTISLLLDVPHHYPMWWTTLYYARQLVLCLLTAGVAAGLLLWTERNAIAASYEQARHGHNWQQALLINACLFAALAIATVVLMGSLSSSPSALVLIGFLALLGATAISLLRVDVPLRGLLAIVLRYRVHAAAALSAGVGCVLLANLAQDGWETLAGATLELTRALLSVYETDVIIDYAERSVRVGNFNAIIENSCSGYEGIALVSAFLTIYVWSFRHVLRFPHAFLLFPIGLLTVWFLNSARIAALVSIGAHVSPHIAVKGFHSQAGWIAFLLVSIAIMVLAHQSSFFARAKAAPKAYRERAAASADRITLAYLVPFVALMVTSIVMAATAPLDKPWYLLKAAAVAAALWYFRDVYRTLDWRVSWEAVGVGVMVGVLWILAAPVSGPGELGGWLAELSWPAAVAWITVRVVGSTVLIPLTEELAFRGFLYRWIQSHRFESVSFSSLSWLGLIISSVSFGLMHQMWIAGILAGIAFAWVMIRSGRLSDAIIAHAAANAVICAWAILAGQWSLL